VWIVKYGIWPIGALMLAAFTGLTLKRPTNLFVWCVVPYLIVLSFIAHKEVRFLFPLVDLAPIILVLAWQEFAHTSLHASLIAHRGKSPIRVVMFALIGANTTGLAVVCLSPAGGGRTILAEHLQRSHSAGTTHLAYVANDATIWKIRIPRFYLNTDVIDDGIIAPCDSTHKTGDWLIAHELKAADRECPSASFYWIEVARGEPEWITPLMDLYNSERDRPWCLYRNEAGPAKNPH
jgi:phosphatidylinositol glycan class B